MERNKKVVLYYIVERQHEVEFHHKVTLTYYEYKST